MEYREFISADGTAMVEHTLPDASKVAMTKAQHTTLLRLARGEGDRYSRPQDVQQMLLNFQKYGAFQPTPEEFAAFRARRDAMRTDGAREDANTGYASQPVHTLFNDLRALIIDYVGQDDRALLMMEELRRRLSAAPSQMDVALKRAIEQKDAAEESARKFNEEATKALQMLATTMIKHEETKSLIEGLERRIAGLKEQLPLDVTAGGRKLEL